jgi:hypothetical protein
MRSSLFVAVALVTVSAATAATAAAQTTTRPVEKMEHHAAASGWKELDTFHTLMAATWHPVSASNDFTVIRQKADSLTATSKRWAESKVPAPCDKKEIRDAIAAVVKGSEAVATLVAKKAPDAEVKTALHDLHEKFEVVEHGCHM